MRWVRWILFALGFAAGSIAGAATRGATPADDLRDLELPEASDDPRELSGWVGGRQWVAQVETAPATQFETSGECSGYWWSFRPSSPGFDCFISPMTNPVFFEDPRTLTEVRVLTVQQKLPNSAPLAGGDLQLLGVQARAALTERLTLVMAKSGFVMGGAPAPLDDGWLDVALGLKYNLYVDSESQRIVSCGGHYEIPAGTDRAWQGNGTGEYHVYLTGGAAVLESSHVLSATGLRLPSDPAAENQVAYWSNHWDTLLWSRGVYVLAEANWYHYLRSGFASPGDIAGLDFFNRGATNVAGNDIVTGAAGLKYKPTSSQEYGVIFEVPLTDRRDLLENRLTVDLIWRY